MLFYKTNRSLCDGAADAGNSAPNFCFSVPAMSKQNKSVISKHYSSEKLIALNTHIKCLAQGHNIQMTGYEPSTSVSRNRHSNHMTNMLQH